MTRIYRQRVGLKFFTVIALLVCLAPHLFASGISLINRCTSKLDNMTQNQKEVLVQAYKFGEQYDFGYTMAAIAWQESCAGEHKVNLQDPSAGVFHTYIPGVFARHPNLKRNGFTENIIAGMLIKDDYLSASETIHELKYWRKRHKNDWSKIVKSYNKGNSWLRDDEARRKAEKYHSGIVAKVRQLKNRLHTIDIGLRLKQAELWKPLSEDDNFRVVRTRTEPPKPLPKPKRNTGHYDFKNEYTPVFVLMDE